MLGQGRDSARAPAEGGEALKRKVPEKPGEESCFQDVGNRKGSSLDLATRGLLVTLGKEFQCYSYGKTRLQWVQRAETIISISWCVEGT